jgi:sugar phosphate isomerase/epimerase
VRFGISTHLYHDQPLRRDHLAAIASRGFTAVELFATRSHFDYHDPAAIERLRGWLEETGLALHGIHAPITDRFSEGRWGTPFSNASADPRRRQAAIEETRKALEIARRIPTGVLVAHLGVPDAQRPSTDDNRREAALTSLQELDSLARDAGVHLTVEVIPNDLSSAASLVRLLEDELDLPDTGICLDFGHAFLMGDLVDAIENVSGHLQTTHIHDNDGRSDSHLVPFDGAIDWPAALLAVQKIGYEGTWLLELGNTGSPAGVLEKAQRVRERFERMLLGVMQVVSGFESRLGSNQESEIRTRNPSAAPDPREKP